MSSVCFPPPSSIGKRRKIFLSLTKIVASGKKLCYNKLVLIKSRKQQMNAVVK